MIDLLIMLIMGGLIILACSLIFNGMVETIQGIKDYFKE